MRAGISSSLTCFGFHVWGEDFLAAENAYARGARPGSFVAHFLCCQSIELSLKAFLSFKGRSRDSLRRSFGHHLGKLFDEAYREGLPDLVTINPGDESVLREANDWYDTYGGKRFQYVDIRDAMKGFRHAPELAGLEDIATRLQAKPLREALLKA